LLAEAQPEQVRQEIALCAECAFCLLNALILLPAPPDETTVCFTAVPVMQ